jgi:hypothetical protein
MEELTMAENQWISGQCRVLVTSFARQSAVPSIRLRGIIYYDMPASMEHYLYVGNIDINILKSNNST